MQKFQKGSGEAHPTDKCSFQGGGWDWIFQLGGDLGLSVVFEVISNNVIL